MAIQAATSSPSPDQGQVHEMNPCLHSAKTVERIALSLLRQAQNSPEISRKLDSFLIKYEIGKQSEKPLVDALITGKINMTQCFDELGVDRESYEKMAEYLDELGEDINKMNADGETPLTEAVDDLRTEKVVLLLEIGAHINQPNGDGYSPLDLAVNNKNSEMINLLMKWGAKLHKIEINKPKADGFTRLERAVLREEKSMIKLLVELGANINQSNAMGITPLAMAVLNKKSEMIKLLVELGAHINQLTREGSSPLDLAVKNEDYEMIDRLWELGAKLNKIDINKSDANGQSLLDQAIINEQPERIKILVKLGANLNQSNDKGLTPLEMALIYRNRDMIKILVKLGADLNYCDPDTGWTPLAFAKSRDLFDMVDFLTTFDGQIQPGEYKPIDIGLSDECYHQKRIAAAWGLKGTTSLRGQVQTLAGGFVVFGLNLVKEGLTHFLFQKKDEITQANRRLIEDAFENSFGQQPDNAYLAFDRIRDGEPVCILGGTRTHSIGIVIYKGQIAICNRGRGSDEKCGITFYQPKSPITIETLEELMTTYPDIESFNAMVNDTLKVDGKPLPQGPQRTGNCFFASTKSMLYALAHMIDPAHAKDFYKEFTAFSREYVVVDYLAHIPEERRNEHLLSLVDRKCMKKIDLKKPHFNKGFEETLFKALEAFKPSPEYLDDSLGFCSSS